MKTEIINDNSAVTVNSKQVELLKQHFPQCFDKDGDFIMQKMQEVVADEGLELSKESYSLNWLGKSYARLLANENPLTLLKEDKVHNSQEPHSDSHNLLIKGDNLEVLKHLSNAYNEAIKMIYIDPPYNTGSDGFVYQDDRKFTAEELSQSAGVDLEEARHILEFTQSKANSHSAWLTFIYPRLYVARYLLKEDGVIFISIDDNEQSQLKLLCDEIFGEENFVANLIWEKRYTRNNDAKLMSNVTDYILSYRKSSKLEKLREPRNEKTDSIYKNPDNDPRGVWTSVSYISQRTKDQRPNLSYKIENPFTGEYVEHEVNAWKYGKDQYEKHRDEKRLYWGVNKNNAYPRLKRFLAELNDGIVPVNLWNYKSTGTIDDGTKMVNELLGKDIFAYPKPISLIQRMLAMAADKNSLVLDFFAGSGTTAHAIMQLNSEDGGNRRFITVQIAESTEEKSEAFKTGYKTIFDITKARIENAATKIAEENPEYQGDLGFKVFETVPVFDGYLDDIEKLQDSSTLFDGRTLNDDELETLLTTWRVYDGMPLDNALEEIVLKEYQAYNGNGTVYMMHSNFQTDDLKAFIKKLDEDNNFEPSKVVLFGYNFTSKHQREFKEALTSYMNRKSIELDLIVRY